MRQFQLLYLVICADGGTYCAGPQRTRNGEEVPGGPLAYESREDAQHMADGLRGTVKSKMLWPMKQRCIELGVVLWVRKADGTHSYFPDTVPDVPPVLIRIEGEEREAAIRASESM